MNWDELAQVDFVTREKAEEIIEVINEGLEELQKRDGIRMFAQFKKLGFSKTSVRGQVEISVVLPLKNGFKLRLNRAAMLFLENAAYFKLPKSALGEKITFKGKTMVITGFVWNGKKTKFVSAHCLDNDRGYKIPHQAILGLLPL